MIHIIIKSFDRLKPLWIVNDINIVIFQIILLYTLYKSRVIHVNYICDNVEILYKSSIQKTSSIEYSEFNQLIN